MIADHSITNILCVVRFIFKKQKVNIIIMILFLEWNIKYSVSSIYAKLHKELPNIIFTM
jgi:hypothetical protein